jgi:drug/metabolite transporter (DMT)-like permease
MNKGVLYGIGAYALWGFFPIYWKALHVVPALQVIGHRIGWSFILLLAYIVARGQWKAFRVSAMNWRTVGIYSIAAILLSFNWLIYVWGVNAGFIVETSLGYYINPLLSVLLGVVFLRERLRPLQWIPVGLATIGVIYLTFAYGARRGSPAAAARPVGRLVRTPGGRWCPGVGCLRRLPVGAAIGPRVENPNGFDSHHRRVGAGWGLGGAGECRSATTIRGR